MGFSALSRMFVIDRHRQRTAGSGHVGFSVPAWGEVKVTEDALPLLATNMRRTFLSTRRSIEGMARYGFSPVTVAEEPDFVNELYRILHALSVENGWANRCSDLPQAIDRLRSSGLEPKAMVISEGLLQSVCGQDLDLNTARTTMAVRGHVAIVDGIQVLLSNLPTGAALVCAAPEVLGFYTRVGDHLGLLVQRVNRAFTVVGDGVA